MIAFCGLDGSCNPVRTEPFHAMKLAFASDGTLWASGYTARNSTVPDSAAKAEVVRHFDRSGRMTEAFIPAETVPDATRPPTGVLAVGGSIVGWASTSALSKDGHSRGSGSYVEVWPDKSIHTYPLPDDFNLKFTSRPRALVLTQQDLPVLTLDAGDHWQNLEAFTLDRASGKWTPQPVPNTLKFLAGGSGPTLAFYDKDESHVRLFQMNP